MQNKLQELTDKLYNEGLSKGKAEGEAILAGAKLKADEIISNARKEAEKIVSDAERSASELKTKVDGDIKMAASQSLQAPRKDIENLVVAKLTDKEVSDALTSPEFVRQMIASVAGKFNTEEAADLNVVLPESLKNSVEPFVRNELGKMLKGGLTTEFSKKISGGFNIAPKDGSYFVSFTDETFKELISSYLRPATRKLLFGE